MDPKEIPYCAPSALVLKKDDCIFRMVDGQDRAGGKPIRASRPEHFPVGQISDDDLTLVHRIESPAWVTRGSDVLAYIFKGVFDAATHLWISSKVFQQSHG
jgi:hypothetical protein